MKISHRHLQNILSKLAKVVSEKPAYKEKKKTDTGYVWVYDDKHIEKRWKEKKNKLKNLNKNIEKLRKQYNKDLSSDDLRTKALAAIVGIMDDTAMRVGNEESVKDSDTYGATTLKIKHLKIENGKARFVFVGKDNVKQDVYTNNKKIISVLKELIKGKKKDDFIFEIDGTKIWDRAVNRYLTPFNISAKDLRGFQANKLMEEVLKKKDWKEALEEVADIVGHEASTLKNQYLDPDLVHKYDKKKAASLSIRADKYQQVHQTELGGAELQSFPAEKYLKQPMRTDQFPVDLNRNVSNIQSKISPRGYEQVKLTPEIVVAWKIMAPFLPLGASLSSGFRSEQDQANTIRNLWFRKWNGYFAKNFSHKGKTIADMVKFLNEEYDPKKPGIPEGGPAKEAVKISLPGGSKHQLGRALDVYGVNYNLAEKIIHWLNANMSDFVEFITLKEGDHIHVSIEKAIYPGPENMTNMLRKYYHGLKSPSLYVSQSFQPILSKRALVENPSALETLRKKLQELGLLRVKDERHTNINPKVKVNDLILNTWGNLRPFLPKAVLTSGVRTSEDQVRIIKDYWNISGLKNQHPGVYDPEQMLEILKDAGYVIASPTTSPHLHGKSFDISGPDLYGMAEKIKELARDGRLPIKLTKVLVEGRNNAVHIEVADAKYNPTLIAEVLRDQSQRYASEDIILSKQARVEEMKNVYDDLLASNPPGEILEVFGPDIEQKAEDAEPNKYEREKDDPKWKKVLLSDGKDWTREEIRNHYKANVDKILKEIKGQPVMLYIGTEKNKNVLKRHHNDKPIVIDNKEDLMYWADRRLLSLHRVFGPKTKLGFVDLDVHGDFPQATVVKYAKEIAGKIKSEYNTKPIIYDSGGSGYHIEFTLKQEKDVDTLRNELRELCEDLNEKYDGFTTGIVKGNGVRTDTTTLKDNGNIRVPYAIHESKGGIKKPLGSSDKKASISKRSEEMLLEEPKDNRTWFEKGPQFVNREEKKDYELSELNESQARELLGKEPEQFFYKGLHKKYPILEVEALKNLLKDRAKFYFVFNYHDRKEPEFQALLQSAAEALSQQDPRAFYYYHLHQKYPELGRGTIIKLIDTNPDSFFDLGLDKEYPDYVESANNARNIKDPNKVELELDQLEEIKTASISKRAKLQEFPKVCSMCGKAYNNYKEFFTLPFKEGSKAEITLDDPGLQCGEMWGEENTDWVYRNCDCDSTLIVKIPCLHKSRKQAATKPPVIEHPTGFVPDIGERAKKQYEKLPKEKKIVIEQPYSSEQDGGTKPREQIVKTMEEAEKMATEHPSAFLSLLRPNNKFAEQYKPFHILKPLAVKNLSTKEPVVYFMDKFYTEKEYKDLNRIAIDKLLSDAPRFYFTMGLFIEDEFKHLLPVAMDVLAKQDPKFFTELTNLEKFKQFSPKQASISKRAADLGLLVDPAGKVYDVGFQGHDEFIARNLQKELESLGWDPENNNDHYGIPPISFLIRNGWIRIGSYGGQMSMGTNTFDDKILHMLQDIISNLPKFKRIYMDVYGSGETISVPLDDFLTANHAYQLKNFNIRSAYISKLAKKDAAGIFIVLPSKLAKQFPSLGKHDDSVPHITALYIGKVPKSKKKLLVEVVKEVAAIQEPFKIELDDKVTYFPATKHSDGCKVAKMKIISKDLHTFHNKLKKVLLSAGIKIDDHFPDYKPHTTLQYMEPPKEKWDGKVPSGSCVIKEVEIWDNGKKTKVEFSGKKLAKRANDIIEYDPINAVEQTYNSLPEAEQRDFLEDIRETYGDRQDVQKWLNSKYIELDYKEEAGWKKEKLQMFQSVVAEIAKLLNPLFVKYQVEEDLIKYVFTNCGDDIEAYLLGGKEPNEIVKDIALREYADLQDELKQEKKDKDLETFMRFPSGPKEELWDPKRIEKKVSASISKRAGAIDVPKKMLNEIYSWMLPLREKMAAAYQKTYGDRQLANLDKSFKITTSGGLGSIQDFAKNLKLKIPSLESEIKFFHGIDEIKDNKTVRKSPGFFDKLKDGSLLTDAKDNSDPRDDYKSLNIDLNDTNIDFRLRTEGDTIKGVPYHCWPVIYRVNGDEAGLYTEKEECDADLMYETLEFSYNRSTGKLEVDIFDEPFLRNELKRFKEWADIIINNVKAKSIEKNFPDGFEFNFERPKLIREKAGGWLISNNIKFYQNFLASIAIMISSLDNYLRSAKNIHQKEDVKVANVGMQSFKTDVSDTKQYQEFKKEIDELLAENVFSRIWVMLKMEEERRGWFDTAGANDHGLPQISILENGNNLRSNSELIQTLSHELVHFMQDLLTYAIKKRNKYLQDKKWRGGMPGKYDPKAYMFYTSNYEKDPEFQKQHALSDVEFFTRLEDALGDMRKFVREPSLWFDVKHIGPQDPNRPLPNLYELNKMERLNVMKNRFERFLKDDDTLKYLRQYSPEKFNKMVRELYREFNNISKSASISKRSRKDILPGGLADKKQPEDFDPEQLKKGIKSELEHTKNKDLALEIAMDHLTEDPKYYDKLEKMEKSAISKRAERTEEPFTETKMVELWHGVRDPRALSEMEGYYYLTPNPKEALEYRKLWFAPAWNEENKKLALNYADYALVKVKIPFEYKKVKITLDDGTTHNRIEEYNPIESGWERSYQVQEWYLYNGILKLNPSQVEIFGKKEASISIVAEEKFAKGDVVELIHDPERGAGIITGKIKEGIRGRMYSVQFFWTSGEFKLRKDEFEQYYEEPELTKKINELPFTTWVPENQLKKSDQVPHPMLKDYIKKKASISIRAKNPLSKYKKMRDFNETREPEGEVEKGKNRHRFVIQKHDADKAGLHFDFRIENDNGTMTSFAIPKHKLPMGNERLLAQQTEDHPISYNKFEGEIEEGYGKGQVDIYDNGTYELIKWENDTIKLKLKGKKEKGAYTLHKTDGKKWMIMVMKDEDDKE